MDRNANFATVNEAILNSAPREWIYNRRVQDIVNELRADANAEAEAVKGRRQKAVGDLANTYARACEMALAADWKHAEDVVKIIEAGDARCLVAV